MWHSVIGLVACLLPFAKVWAMLSCRAGQRDGSIEHEYQQRKQARQDEVIMQIGREAVESKRLHGLK